jgi:hypothetical protein
MTVHDAARVLGISEDAVRMRVKRGTLDAEREGGRLYVMLEAEPTTDPTGRTEMIDELRDRLRYIEGQFDQERTASAELRRIIAALTQRIPELPPPAEPSSSPDATESPETAATDAGRVDVGDAETGAPRRPWWRRIFG